MQILKQCKRYKIQWRKSLLRFENNLILQRGEILIYEDRQSRVFKELLDKTIKYKLNSKFYVVM